MEPSLPESVRAARAGAFHWDLASGVMHWDDAVCDLVGVAPEDFSGRAEAFFAALHASDAARLAAATAEVLERGGRYRNRYRIVRREGGVRRIEERGGAFRVELPGRGPAGQARWRGPDAGLAGRSGIGPGSPSAQLLASMPHSGCRGREDSAGPAPVGRPRSRGALASAPAPPGGRA
ncbi:PAS domain-containing protein [Streptacidiphilus neutrinimicus]|uniref:PAS domain-containing protein n=1 Tax=Streptacidiphilus neutrinimicus TaxID=105420 RepID=UPI0005A99DBA|nr:PAS domain-containing protein [Streptacidiphilus neutrinimicus]